MRLSRKLAVATAIAGAVSLLIPSSSYAVGVGVTVVVGTGTINPGLTTQHAPQTVAFGGTAVGVAAGVDKPAGPDALADAGALNCTFNGGSVGAENSLLGQGNVNGTCTGGTLTVVTVNCPSLAYDRYGPLVVVYGDGHTHDYVNLAGTLVTGLTSAKCTVTATQPTLGTTVIQTVAVYGVFVFVPLSVQPTTSYALAGATVGLTQIIDTL